jgi:hypothetical protein
MPGRVRGAPPPSLTVLSCWQSERGWRDRVCSEREWQLLWSYRQASLCTGGRRASRRNSSYRAAPARACVH